MELIDDDDEERVISWFQPYGLWACIRFSDEAKSGDSEWIRELCCIGEAEELPDDDA